MASGTPDYFQTVRQAYGAAKTTIKVLAVTASADNELMDIAGKGIIYGGSLYLSYPSTQKDAIPKLSVDGVEISTVSFYTMNYFELTKLNSYPWVLTKYDDVGCIYCVGIGFGLTFDASIKLVYQEVNDATPTVIARLIYALLE
ncbi:MAG: hypothetical protein KAV87_63095 [Desulfobacteraceae bacterium]|nr:hypothetical protein [Desulfobacteraceae bacterium]